MKVTRGVLILRGLLAFLNPGIMVFITNAKEFTSKPDSWSFWLLALGAIGAGTGALSAWFDQSYGRATAPAPEEDSRETLNFSDKVKPTPEEAVVRALVAKGLSEANARGYVAISLKDAAGIAGVDLTTL